jgi:hypothetical protein
MTPTVSGRTLRGLRCSRRLYTQCIGPLQLPSLHSTRFPNSALMLSRGGCRPAALLRCARLRSFDAPTSIGKIGKSPQRSYAAFGMMNKRNIKPKHRSARVWRKPVRCCASDYITRFYRVLSPRYDFAWGEPSLSGSIQMISATVCILQRRNYGVKPMAHTMSNLRRACGASRSQPL